MATPDRPLVRIAPPRHTPASSDHAEHAPRANAIAPPRQNASSAPLVNGTSARSCTGICIRPIGSDSVA